jgi:hypothetical protein
MFPRTIKLIKKQIGMLLEGKEPVNAVLRGAPENSMPSA